MGTHTFVRTITREKLTLGMTTYFFAACLVFFATGSATVYYWYTQNNNVQRDTTAAFETEIQSAEYSISQRMQSYEDIMRGCVGLINASDKVSLAEWKNFIDEFDVAQRYPGVEGFGYIQRVSRDNLQAHINEQRLENPAYNVTPAGDRDDYYPIVYVEPYTAATTPYLGNDIFTNPSRRDAMIKARDTGVPTATSRVVLRTDAARNENYPGFVVYVPIYQVGSKPTERQQALTGYIYAGFRVNNFLTNVLQADTAKLFGFRMYDGDSTSNEHFMFESSSYGAVNASGHTLRQTRKFRFANHMWTMQYVASNDLIPQRERLTPVSTLVRGLATGLFFAVVVYYLLVNRANKLASQKQQEVQNAKDELLSLASHQLRTPATVVKQYVGMLLHGYVGKLTPQQKSMLVKAYDSNERQLNIINQILYVARLDAGRISLNREIIDINTLLREVVREHTESVKERGQSLRIKIPRKVIKLPVDRQYLHMAIDNILSNASKYTPDGGTITVILQKVDTMAEIHISDTGIGIEEESIPYVFDKFTRIDSEMSAKSSGSGIGLYLAGQIISLHGGEIKVESETNKGSTFIISLPLTAPPSETKHGKA